MVLRKLYDYMSFRMKITIEHNFYTHTSIWWQQTITIFLTCEPTTHMFPTLRKAYRLD
jgi:hypothetical protein